MENWKIFKDTDIAEIVHFSVSTFTVIINPAIQPRHGGDLRLFSLLAARGSFAARLPPTSPSQFHAIRKACASTHLHHMISSPPPLSRSAGQIVEVAGRDHHGEKLARAPSASHACDDLLFRSHRGSYRGVQPFIGSETGVEAENRTCCRVLVL